MPLLFLWCHYFFKVLLHYNNVVILILLFNCWYYLRNRNHAVAVAISSKNDAEPKQNPKEKVFPVIVCFGHTKCTICPTCTLFSFRYQKTICLCTLCKIWQTNRKAVQIGQDVHFVWQRKRLNYFISRHASLWLSLPACWTAAMKRHKLNYLPENKTW